MFGLFVRLVLSTFFLFCSYVTLVLSALSFLFVCYITSNRAVVCVCFYINSSLALSFLFVFYTSCKLAMCLLFVCHVSCNRSLSFLFVSYFLTLVLIALCFFYLFVTLVLGALFLICLLLTLVVIALYLFCLFVILVVSTFCFLGLFFFVHCKCVVFKCIEIRPQTPPFWILPRNLDVYLWVRRSYFLISWRSLQTKRNYS